jgi:single-stranded DNA-binding protein
MQSIKKGDPVIVVGEVSYRSWEGKDGKTAGRMEVTAKEVGLSMKRFAVSASRRDAGLQPALESDPWATPAPF